MNVTDSASDAHPMRCDLRSTWQHRPLAAHWVGHWQATSQKHLRCLGSRLVTLATGERDWVVDGDVLDGRKGRKGRKERKGRKGRKRRKGRKGRKRRHMRRTPLWWWWDCSIPKDVISVTVMYGSPGVTWIGRIAKIHCPCPWVLKLRSTSSTSSFDEWCSWTWLFFLMFSWVLDIFDVVHLPFIYHSFSIHSFAAPGYEKRSDGFHCAAGYVGAVEVSRMISSEPASE